MTMTSTSTLAMVLLAVLAPSALGHGWITEPPARNAASSPRNGHCPHCGNGGGVCGDGGQWPGSSNYLGGQNAGPQRTYTAGDVVEVKVRITAHHRGHMELHVCDEHLGPLTRDPEGPSGCLNKHVLLRVPPEEVHGDCRPNDARGDCQPLDTSYPERWYLPPGTGEHTMHFRIPQDLQCTSCTLQWRWWTANSCIPADGYGCYFQRMNALGWDASTWCGAFCGTCSGSLLQSNASHAHQRALSQRMGCGEEFRNCADIAVLPGSGQPPAATTQAPMTTMAPTPSATMAPSPTPSPSTTAATTRMPTGTACDSCTGDFPCIWTDGKCYPRMAQAVCEQTQGAVWCGRPSSTPEPETEPEPEPEATTSEPEMEPEPEATTSEPEMEPEPEATTPVPQRCVAKPGNNGGATDAYCAQCETGYQWWPCNNAALCEGAGCIMSAMQVQAEHKKISPHNHFLGTALIQAGAALDRAAPIHAGEAEL